MILFNFIPSVDISSKISLKISLNLRQPPLLYLLYSLSLFFLLLAIELRLELKDLALLSCCKVLCVRHDAASIADRLLDVEWIRVKTELSAVGLFFPEIK